MTIDRQTAGKWILLGVIAFTLLQGYHLQKVERRNRLLSGRGELLQEVVDHTTTAVIVVDADNGHIVEWNEGAAQLTGWSNKEAVGKPLSYLMPPSARDSHVVYLHDPQVRSKLRSSPMSRDCWVISKNKVYLPVHARVATVGEEPELYLILLDPVDAVRKMPGVPKPDQDPSQVATFDHIGG